MNTLVVSNTTVNLEQLYPDRHLDSAAKATFEDLTRLATSIVQTPIALISLCDTNGQWLPAQVGLEADSTEQYLEFCRKIHHEMITTTTSLISDSDPLPPHSILRRRSLSYASTGNGRYFISN